LLHEQRSRQLSQVDQWPQIRISRRSPDSLGREPIAPTRAACCMTTPLSCGPCDICTQVLSQTIAKAQIKRQLESIVRYRTRGPSSLGSGTRSRTMNEDACRVKESWNWKQAPWPAHQQRYVCRTALGRVHPAHTSSGLESFSSRTPPPIHYESSGLVDLPESSRKGSPG